MTIVPVADWKRLNIPGLQAGDILLTEDAHTIPQTRKSMSQPCTYEENVEIAMLARAKGVEIRTMSQKQTASLRSKYRESINQEYPKYVHLLEKAQQDLDKNEAIDLLAWSFHIADHPGIIQRFKRFNPREQDEHSADRELVWAERDMLNVDLNVARTGGPKLCYRHENDEISQWITSNIETIESALTEEQLETLNWKVVHRGKPEARVDDKPQKRLYTLLATLMQPDGSPRLRPGIGKLPHWKYVKQVFFGMTPFHDKAGVAASNVKWWWRMFASPFPKGAVHRHADDQGFRAGRAYMDRQIRDIWRTLRSLVISSQPQLG